jgi:hypothetical protein
MVALWLSVWDSLSLVAVLGSVVCVCFMATTAVGSQTVLPGAAAWSALHQLLSLLDLQIGAGVHSCIPWRTSAVCSRRPLCAAQCTGSSSPISHLRCLR